MGYMRVKEELVGSNCCGATRAEIEKLERRSNMLRSEDRRLVEMVVSYGMSFNRIAEITGDNPRAIASRYKRLCVVLGNDGLAGGLAESGRGKTVAGKIMYDKLVGGYGYRQLARKYRVSEYKVRKILKTGSRQKAVGRREGFAFGDTI